MPKNRTPLFKLINKKACPHLEQAFSLGKSGAAFPDDRQFFINLLSDE